MAVFTNINGTYSAGLAPEIQEYFDRALIRDFANELVHTRDLQKRPLPLNNGRTVQYRKWHPFTPTNVPLKEGVTPDGKKIRVSEIHATVKPYGDYVAITDELNLVAVDNVTRETSRLLNRQAYESIDMITADALNSGMNVMYAKANGALGTSRAGIVAGTDVLTGAHVKKAVRALEKANAKRFPDGFFHAVIDPDTKYSLTEDPLWVDIAKYQDKEKVEKYEIGKMHGVKFYESNLAKKFEGTEALFENASGAAVTTLALNGGKWDVETGLGFITVAKTTAYSGGTDADYAYICRRMANKLVTIMDGDVSINALIDKAFVDDTNLKFTLRYMDTAANWTYASGDKVNAQATTGVVHSTIIYGEDHAGSVELGGNGGNVQTIMHPPGSAGAEDPLNQRGTIAWKVKGFCAVLLQDAYLVRIEHSVLE